MLCVDARYGNLLHLPYSGGAMEQPIYDCEVYFVLQDLYREILTKKLDGAIRKR